MMKKALVTLFALGVTTVANAQYSKAIAVVSNTKTTLEQRLMALQAYKQGEKADRTTISKDSTVFTFSYKKYEATIVDTDRNRFRAYQEKNKNLLGKEEKIVE